MIVTNRYSQTIILKDERQLGYAEYRDSVGLPIFYFHGHRSSRLEPKVYDLDKFPCDARIIAVDRPGYGLSDFQKGRTLLDWPQDVVELANALEINKFAVLGGSGGGPYVAACAYKIPHRLTVCGIACMHESSQNLGCGQKGNSEDPCVAFNCCRF